MLIKKLTYQRPENHSAENVTVIGTVSDDRRRGVCSDKVYSFILTIVYFAVTMAHELSHNLVSGHTKEHGFYTESFATKYLPKLVDLLASLN